LGKCCKLAGDVRVDVDNSSFGYVGGSIDHMGNDG
jgi:hypothetical protein